MSKFGLYSDKAAATPFESHLEGLEEEETKSLDLRNFVKNLGDNAKSLTFRTFLDIQPRLN